MGNKARYLHAISREVANVARPEGLRLDLFAGSGVVSRELAKQGPVVSADIQTYSKIFALALTAPEVISGVRAKELVVSATENADRTLSRIQGLVALEDEALRVAREDPAKLISLLECGSLAQSDVGSADLSLLRNDARQNLNPVANTLVWYYGGVYFSYRQAVFLDELLRIVRAQLSGNAMYTAIAAAMGTASDSVSTVGNHFAQPVQMLTKHGEIKPAAVKMILSRRHIDPSAQFLGWLERYSAISPSRFPCTAVTGDYINVLEENAAGADVVYADPPYTRDHYSRFYHVLETMAVGDDPGVTFRPGTNEPSKGLYRVDRHQSPFSIRSQAPAAFRKLISSVSSQEASLILSYSPMGSGTVARPETRVIGVADLADLMSEAFRDVAVINIDNSTHSRFNKRSLHGQIPSSAEILLVGKA